MQAYITNEIDKFITTAERIRSEPQFTRLIEDIVNVCVASLQSGHKIMFAGNGGSAADAQHLAAELVSRLCYNRPGLAGLALTTDTSALTAIGNDYSFENIFSRQIEAIGQQGDVLIAISTSGSSPNILAAVKAARAKKIITVGFTGNRIAPMTELCEYTLQVPSIETPKIQECHIMLGHIICALIEETMYGAEYNPKRKQG